MKKASWIVLSLIVWGGSLSFAMKRSSNLVPTVKSKKVTFDLTEKQQGKQTTVQKEQEIRLIGALNRKLEQEEDKIYSQRFYYVSGVKRNVALQYCEALCQIQPGFVYAMPACESYEEHLYHYDSKTALLQKMMEILRPFLMRYTQTVIKVAKSLRTPRSHFISDRIKNKCTRAIKAIQDNHKLLAYILTGQGDGLATKEQLQDKWNEILQMCPELQQHEESTVSDKE